MTSVDPTARPWWQPGVIYQVYPRSFQDSDGDGIGDLPGIATASTTSQWLGVDAIWISPIFRSPMADFGYDVADYRDVDPLFGTLADLDRLIADAHERGIRVILDFVPNHTSDQHPWFVESRSRRARTRKRDWYVWARPGAGRRRRRTTGVELFGGTAWDVGRADGAVLLPRVPRREQPDLNWRNPDVRGRDATTCCASGSIAASTGSAIDVLWHAGQGRPAARQPAGPRLRRRAPGRRSGAAT